MNTREAHSATAPGGEVYLFDRKGALMRTNVIQLALILGLSLIFADGFESADFRYWSEPTNCTLPNGDPAPLCPESMDYMAWLASCEAGEHCYHVCLPPPDSCLLLGVNP